MNVLSYKYAEAIAPEMKRSGDAYRAASDTADGLDLRIIQRGLEYRDARLRDVLAFALAKVNIESVDNTIDVGEKLMYHLSIEDTIKDNILKPLAIIIHRYLVDGILYDWYAKSMGMKQSQVYEAELLEMERAIANKLRSSRVTRPYEPKI